MAHPDRPETDLPGTDTSPTAPDDAPDTRPDLVGGFYALTCRCHGTPGPITESEAAALTFEERTNPLRVAMRVLKRSEEIDAYFTRMLHAVCGS